MSSKKKPTTATDNRVVKPVEAVAEEAAKRDLEKELKRSIAGLKSTITERNKRIEKLESRLKDCEATIVYLENQLTKAVEANEAKDRMIKKLSTPWWKRLFRL